MPIRPPVDRNAALEARRVGVTPGSAPTRRSLSELHYDYSHMDAALRRQVQEAAADIHEREQRAARDLLAIGRRLLTIKAILPHGQFEDWTQVEFGYSERMAQDLMNVSRRFDGKSELNALLSATTLRMLAAPSVPDAAVEAVVAQARREARPLLVREVKEIIAEHKNPRLARLTAYQADADAALAEAALADLDDDLDADAEPPTIAAAYTVRELPAMVALPRDLAERLHAALQTRDLRALTAGDLAELDQLFTSALSRSHP